MGIIPLIAWFILILYHFLKVADEDMSCPQYTSSYNHLTETGYHLCDKYMWYYVRKACQVWEIEIIKVNDSEIDHLQKQRVLWWGQVCLPEPKGRRRDFVCDGNTCELHKNSPGEEGMHAHHQRMATTTQPLFSNKMAF